MTSSRQSENCRAVKRLVRESLVIGPYCVMKTTKGLTHMKLEDATAYVARCFNGEPASCSFACPFSLDIRSFNDKVSKGRWLPAYKLLRNAVVFPSVVAALCPQPCREHCQRTQTGDEPLAMRDLEAAAIKYAKNRKPEQYVIPPKTQKIAVVGAGPAGLACALSLAQKKYIVTVYDKAPGWGGSLRQHPRFAEFEEDFKLQFSGIDAEFRFDTEITSLETLDGCDAVYVATGKNGNDFGLRQDWSSDLMTTPDPRIFLGGELTGVPLLEAIAQGAEASRFIEGYLQTGKASRMGGAPPDRKNCERYLCHDGAEKKPLVPKADGETYTEEEAKAEAARCFLCDCDACEAQCEMLKWYRKKPQKLGLEAYTDSIANSLVSTRTLTREAYSCNICGHCKAVCPVDVDTGALLQFSRADRVAQDKQVPAFHDYWLRDFDFNRTEGAFAAAPKGQTTCDLIFFPGCKLGASNPEHVLKAYDWLRSKHHAGLALNCCGAPVYWAGETARLTAHHSDVKKIWESLGKPAFVFACAYCESIFRQFLPDIPRVSLYELLARDTALVPARPFAEAAVFDPCAARHAPEMQQAVRTLAERSGAALSALKEPNRCCGFGGHMSLANPELYKQITENRAAASDKPYIAYCANCKEVFSLQGKPVAHVLDAVFSMDADTPVPSLQQKKENSLEVKGKLMKALTGEAFTPASQPWDSLELVISPGLLEEMDRKLIPTDDLREAIWQAEQSGEAFVDQDGVRQCSMVRPALTTWVQYKPMASGQIEILDAFTHRMHFSRED